MLDFDLQQSGGSSLQSRHSWAFGRPKVHEAVNDHVIGANGDEVGRHHGSWQNVGGPQVISCHTLWNHRYDFTPSERVCLSSDFYWGRRLQLNSVHDRYQFIVNYSPHFRFFRILAYVCHNGPLITQSYSFFPRTSSITTLIRPFLPNFTYFLFLNGFRRYATMTTTTRPKTRTAMTMRTRTLRHRSWTR